MALEPSGTNRRCWVSFLILVWDSVIMSLIGLFMWTGWRDLGPVACILGWILMLVGCQRIASNTTIISSTLLTKSSSQMNQANQHPRPRKDDMG